jgi:hypothetical protein
MPAAAAPIESPYGVDSRLNSWTLTFVAAAAAIVVTLMRFDAANGLPLWLDETFTAVISGQPTLQDFIREAHRDVGAPLYYLVMWVLPGDSDLALRLPSLVLMLCAAALPIVWRIPNQSRSAAVTWGTLLLLWPPGGPIAFDARPYALVFFLATAQTIAFARLIARPSIGRAMLWTGAAALCILSHYFSGVLGLAQGIVLLVILRRRAFALWPALLLLVPAFVEVAVHLPVLVEFAGGSANWLPTFGPAMIAPALIYTTGSIGPVMLVLAAATRLLRRDEPIARAVLPAIIAGLGAILLLFALGWGRSLLVERYFTACVPSVLLGLVTLAGGQVGRLALIAGYTWAAVHSARTEPMTAGDSGLEEPAQYLIASRPERLVYSLGYAGQTTLAREMRQQLGEFHFRREGLTTRAELIATLEGSELVRSAGRDAAIIWFLDPGRQAQADAIARIRPCVIIKKSRGATLACPALDSGTKRLSSRESGRSPPPARRE